MNKKGFTLIELLAVIVILAIIALIATPIVLNMIGSARKSAAKSSALGYIEAIEYNNALSELNSDLDLDYQKTLTGDVDVSQITVKLKGKKPDSGTVSIDEDGKVTSANIDINGYNVEYKNNVAVVKGKSSIRTSKSTFGGTYVEPSSSDTHKGIVYMNPKNLKAECNSSLSVSATGTKDGCMKFYIFDDSNDEYKMILDHNTSGNVAWLSDEDKNNSCSDKNYEECGPLTLNKQLETDTEGWVVSSKIISADEFASIVGISNLTYNDVYFFNTGEIKPGDTKMGKGESPYSWLFDNTAECEEYGCNIQDNNEYTNNGITHTIDGYWTSTTPSSDNGYFPWHTFRIGMFYGMVAANNGGNYGVRPVITLSQSQIK